MKQLNSLNKKWKRWMLVSILVSIAGISIGIFLYFHSQSKGQTITFVYQGTSQSSAHMKSICATKGWSAKDIDLKIYEQGEDISEQVKEVKTKVEQGMDITYTWKEDSFVLHVFDKNYTPPVFDGPVKVDLTKDSVVAKNVSVYGIHAKDYCGNDISDRIVMETAIDTSVIGEKEVILSIEDAYQHKSEYTVMFHIKEATQDNEIEYNDGIANPLSITPTILANPEQIDVLVNKFNILPDDWTPSDLVNITSNNDRTMRLRKDAAVAFEQMNAAALQDDIVIRVISSYRTKEYQESLFTSYYNDDPIYAYKYSALPRRSEHETGLAIDVSYDDSLWTDLHTSDLGAWMDKHAHEYGFMLRFLEGKETSTNYAFEPWHYRYVGKDIATKIKAQGCTMEEYYGSK